ncbi:HNH endonuclease [Vreelandella nanhaiensis]|uniref:HNH endonuclease n=1 Tax=Vreelandella nanhaiensis TaxID=1258546 RepID=A0A433KNG7_9GAMM|nr:hypothetical protein [Halomonas nanhaiensis]RUR31159.1 hypothetical protein ELY38_10885 [Halomonas nanhaiensis]
MNNIPRPAYDDYIALQNLANNKGVGSYPSLQSFVTCIQQGYRQYEALQGNASHITSVVTSPVVEKHLKAHFRKPPQDLKHITELREESEYLVCPMCGSLHGGTLDHLLPKSKYGGFAIYSLNLVPACKCNNRRGELVIGTNADERILHPYFDHCLSERLIEAHFEDLGPVPKVGLRLCIDDTHPEYVAIEFHFRSIVKKTAVQRYLKDRWADICRKPSLVVRSLKNNPQTRNDLKQILEEELDMLDDIHRGKNNWNSIFIAGLLDRPVLQWLFNQLYMPGRLPGGPLV